jgi:small subunit ribosomal protein S1
MSREQRGEKPGSMQKTADSRQVPLADREWWTAIDEGYWQALLTQGEIGPEAVVPVDSQEIFHILDVESQASSTQEASARERPELVLASAPGTEDGWQVAQRALDQGDLFCLRVAGVNRGGLLVDWNGVQGFVPASHLKEMPKRQNLHERLEELTRYIGGSITVRLIEVDPRQNRLVFSERATLAQLPPSAILSSLRPGHICRGMVTNLTSFGAFVDVGGVEGLIHISEISWDRVHNPGDVLQPGQEVEVHVLGVNPDEGRIALSLKRMRPNPWMEIGTRYHVGEVLEGRVTNVVSFGAFVRLEEGVEGLIHVSELAEGNFLHPRNVVREGDTVRVRVLNIDPANQRLGLSLRQVRDAGLGAS